FKEIDFTKSIMVGDTDSDIVFGQNLGMKTVLVKSNEKTTVTADLIVTNLAELVKTLFEE
ncbi:MAG: D-glycero-D-manno-heptose 1,7-bisphosphate phosphatase, partial [Psychromonas sp.]